MGTSRGYKMPTGGNWTPLKNDATDFVQGTGNADITPSSLLTDFIRATGGLKALLRGHGGSVPSSSGKTGSGAKTKGGGGAPEERRHPIALDFLVIAGSCYVIDKAVVRRSAADAWTRDLDVSFPVSDPKLWEKVADRLDTALTFLSGDVWRTSFRASSCELFVAPKLRQKRTVERRIAYRR
jgi:hypothetical protein